MAIKLFVRAFAETAHLFRGAHQLGILTFDMAIGYLAGWMIYHLTTWRPRTSDQDRAMVPAAKASLKLAGTARALLGGLQQAV